MATKGVCRAVTTAMAIAGRGARACDVCAGKSASWYCGADAAYLCDRCDTQVHSANSLSLRHERVRLTPSGAPRKPTTDSRPSPPPRKRSMSKILHTPVPQVFPFRKRSRTTRPHPHHRQQQQQQPEDDDEEEEEQLQLSKLSNPEPIQSTPKQSTVKTDAEELQQLLTFDDLFDTEDFLIVDDDTHEVPSLITVSPESSPVASTELESSFDAFSPDFHTVSSPSEDSNFAAYFKGKAALDDDVMSDHFLVPDTGLDTGVDPLACDVDGGITLTGEACFIPGEIPELDGFEDFGSRELGSLRFDLDPSAGETESESHPSNAVETEQDHFANGPFAKFFSSRRKAETTTAATTQQLSPEVMKSEAKEILRCCREGLSEEALNAVPSLQLNYDDVIAAWSDRGEPWVNPDGLVPDLGLDDPSGAGREARVLRYKEKRRSRLFSKTIRYEVRKLNAERRPRMKGRFVKRTSNS